MEVEMAEKKEAREHVSWPNEEVRGHLRSARTEMRKSVESLFPPEFIEHRRAARREMLLAARALIDSAIERT
jgi:predicted nuclease with RNAse H fold